jgi:hypothetical protein
VNRFFILLIVLFGCEKLKPESVNIPDYPNLEETFNQQIQLLGTKKLTKEVWLDGKSESKIIEMDSILWKKELSFLKEINPNTPEYVGAFEKLEDEFGTQLTLMPDEKGELKKLTYVLDTKKYVLIKATIHEEREVYVHHREFNVTFENGLLKSYRISGYQKIMLKDTIEFRITGEVN